MQLILGLNIKAFIMQPSAHKTIQNLVLNNQFIHNGIAYLGLPFFSLYKYNILPAFPYTYYSASLKAFFFLLRRLFVLHIQ